MVHCCCAFGCSNRFAKNTGIGFFRIPTNPKRRKLWSLALRRKDFEPGDTHRVCGAHFQSGRPSSDPDNPDYVPNMFVFKSRHRNRKEQARKELEIDSKNVIITEIQIKDKPINQELLTTCDVEELSEIEKNALRMKSEIEMLSTETSNAEKKSELLDTDVTESTCESVGEEEDEYYSLKLELYEAYTEISSLKKEKDTILKILSASEEEEKILQHTVSEKQAALLKVKKELQQAYEEINVLRSEKDVMQKKVASSDLTNRMLQDAKELYFYTGVRSTKDFHSILALIYDVDSAKKIFPITTQLLIALMKLRLNFLYSDLAFRFQTSRNTVQRICEKIIPILDKKLELMIKSQETNASMKTVSPCHYRYTVYESLYNRIQRFMKSEAKQNEIEDVDFESM